MSESSKKYPDDCGGCWFTHEKHLEHEANAIIFDQTRYRNAKYGKGKGWKKEKLPDFKNRNTESQYWVWWPRESASKGYPVGTKWSIVGESGWDSGFNLTASYRRDSG